ncbi:MAG: flagellin [Pseudomonadota bacterium]
MDRTKIQTDIDAIATQVEDITEAASFNGLNLLQGTDSVDILSSLNRSSSSVTPDYITIERQNLEQSAGVAGTTAAVSAAASKGILTTNTAGTAATFATGTQTAGAVVADGQAETINFAGEIIDTGDTFAYTIDVAGTAVTAEYVAAEGETSNDVVENLASLLQAELIENNITDVDVSFSTSSNPSQNNVSLVVTNNTGSAFNAASTLEVNTGGTAGGGLANLGSIDVSTASGASTALTQIDDLLETAIDAASAFGSVQNRIDTQSDFIQSLIDSLELGVSALVDADLTAASARLNALQVQQQLGIQSLGIANQGPQTILALFR